MWVSGASRFCVERAWDQLGVQVSCDSDRCILWFEDSTLVDV